MLMFRLETHPAISLVQTSENPMGACGAARRLAAPLYGSHTGVGPAELLSKVRLGKGNLLFP